MNSKIEEIAKIKKYLDDGLIDLNEFNKLKSEIINRDSSKQSTEQEKTNPIQKQRHGCVTTYLYFIIICGSISVIYFITCCFDVTIDSFYNYNMKYYYVHRYLVSDSQAQIILYLYAIVDLCNIVFAIQLLRWKKSGFWGILTTSIIMSLVYLSYLDTNFGMNVTQFLFTLLSIAILYGILQFKRNNVSAWDNLD